MSFNLYPGGIIIFLAAVFCTAGYIFLRPLLDAYYFVVTKVFKVFKRGDRLTFYDKEGKADFYGYVKNINPSVTIVVDDGNYHYVIPNSKIFEGKFRNDGVPQTEVRRYIPFELHNFEDLDAAKKIMIEEGRKLEKRMSHGKEAFFKVGNVRPNKLEIKLYYWATLNDTFYLGDDLTEAIVREFTEKNIMLGNIPESKKGYI